MTTRLIDPTPSAYSYPLLIKRLLLSGVRYEPDQEIVYRDQARLSYRELNARIHKLANVLTELGVKAGDTVAVLDWDSHRYLECYFAVPMVGAVLHHVNVRLSPEQIHYTMDHAEDRWVLLHDDFAEVVGELAPRLPQVEGYIRLTDDQSSTIDMQYVGEYEALLAGASDQFEFPDFDENTIATTFYTTGTTGNPKGVCFSHRQLVLHTLNAASVLGSYEGLPLLRSDDVYMPMTPMFHVHAWGVPYVATMLGVKQVYPGRYDPDFLVKLFLTEKVTFSHGVPAVLQMILSSDMGQQNDLTGWKLLTGGSAPTVGLARQMAEKGIRFHTAYGMSETCPLLTSTYLHADERELDTDAQIPLRVRTGIPQSLVDLKIIDAEGNTLPEDGETMGELVVRAPWLTQGYYKDPQNSEALWAGGWLHTGDVASIDPRGVVQIRDRTKDVIKTGGEWISSLALESLISHLDGVQEVAVVGVPDPRWDERPVALVVPAAGRDLSEVLVREHLMHCVERGEINKWAVPERIEIVPTIPKTSVGKMDKKVIRAQLG